MENNFNEAQKKVFNTIERMVSAFQNKDIESVLTAYEDGAIAVSYTHLDVYKRQS